MSSSKSLTRRLLMGSVVFSLLVMAGAATVIATKTTNAQTPAPSPTTQAAGTSNEDPAHEANESPEQEAAENNGTFHGGHGGKHGSNEDPQHETGESAAREAQEDANGGGQPTAPSSSSGTTAPAN